MTNGIFIVFEGGDGAGKSTQSERLASWLTSQGYRVRKTFEPGDTVVGQTVRQIVLHSDIDLSPRAEALFYAADKAQHISEVIKPSLKAGMIVICDRYVDSTIAYQGAGRILETQEVADIAWWAVQGLVPDLTVLMDVPVTHGLSRIDSHDRMESAGLGFHTRVRQHFLDSAHSNIERYLIVKGTDPKDEVTAQIRDAVTVVITDSHRNLIRDQVETN